MTKIDMIKEAEEQLRQERLEKEKQTALAELRVIENRVDFAKITVKNTEDLLEKQNQTLEKEEAAAAKYKESGDYEAYKEELGLVGTPSMTSTLSAGSSTSFGMSSLSGTSNLFSNGSGGWATIRK